MLHIYQSAAAHRCHMSNHLYFNPANVPVPIIMSKLMF